MGNKGKKKKKRDNEPPLESTRVTFGMGFPFAPAMMSRNTTIEKSTVAASPQSLTVSETVQMKQTVSCFSETMSISAPNVPIMIDTPGPLTTPVSNFMSTLPIDKNSTLLIFSQSNVKYISGVCNISLLHGKANINGFKLRLNYCVEVRNPVWMPAARLFVDTPTPPASKVSRKQFLSNLCQNNPRLLQIQAQLLSNVDNTMTLLLCESSPSLINRDWMLLAEDWSPYTFHHSPVTQDKGSALLELQSSSVASLPMCLVGASPDFVNCGLEYTTLPPDWVSSVDDVCKSIKTCPRTVLCGAKGVGKYVTFTLSTIGFD